MNEDGAVDDGQHEGVHRVISDGQERLQEHLVPEEPLVDAAISFLKVHILTFNIDRNDFFSAEPSNKWDRIIPIYCYRWILIGNS